VFPEDVTKKARNPLAVTRAVLRWYDSKGAEGWTFFSDVCGAPSRVAVWA